jgi:MerR family transcriptional regulator, redox-sensitive transcriptional activator SoxR
MDGLSPSCKLKYTSSQVMDTTLLSITEVGEATGLPSSALRFYEREGLISPRARKGGRRHYSRDVLQRLAVIGLLQEVGFSIKEVAALLRRGTKGWRPLADEKLKEIDAHLLRVNEARELLVSALACGCDNLDTCDLVSARRGRHGRAVRTLALGFGSPGARPMREGGR